MQAFKMCCVMTFLMALLLFIGCGGDGGGRGEPISGTLEVQEFRIPAGTTRVATGDLKIIATGPIEIAGTLRVDPNVAVSLYAGGDVTISGSILGTAPRAGRGRQDGDKPLIIGGQNVTLTDASVLGWVNRGTSIYIVTNDETGSVTISSSFKAPDGVSSWQRGMNGGNGGDIRIGDVKARSKATEERGRQYSRPGRIRISASLSGGHGGDGFDDRTGVDEGDTLRLTGTNGGAGGSIVLDCKDGANLSRALLQGGNGGDGGDAGDSVGNDYAKARNGSAEGEKGQNVFAQAGDGGMAGWGGLLEGDTWTQLPFRSGNGGNAGHIGVSAGNGGPGGAGGDTTCVLGAMGQVRSPTGNPGMWGELVLKNGGNGGHAATPNKNGGPGGAVKISVGLHHPRELYGVSFVILKDYGRGGNGFNGCSVRPVTFGTHGGAGGMLDAGGLSSDLFDLFDSLVGGNAGDGNPPGVKGRGGRDEKGTQFPDGKPGLTCNLSGKVVILAHDLRLNNQVVFRAGERIATHRFTGIRHQGPEVGCDRDHVHTQSGTFTIDDKGPFEDPNPHGCGIGVLSSQ